MGLRRHGDIPGEEIPQVYFDWVRRRDARVLARVFEHNRQDIVSLAALAVLACQWVEEGRAEDPRDVFSLARVLERARLYDRSEAEYRRALDLGPRGAARARAPAPRVARQASGGARQGRGTLGRAGEGGRGRRVARAWPCTTGTGSGTSSRRSLLSSAGSGSLLPQRHHDVRAWHQAAGFERRQQRLLRKRARRGA